MTAPRRGKFERSNAQELDDRLVAFVGLGHALGANASGIFGRCGLRPVECADAESASRILMTIAPDAIVVDTHQSEWKALSGGVADLIHVLETPPRLNSALIVLNSAGLSKELRESIVRFGGLLLPACSQTHRQLAAVIRRVCGLPDGCCAIGELPTQALTHRQFARYIGVTPAH